MVSFIGVIIWCQAPRKDSIWILSVWNGHFDIVGNKKGYVD
ncbi:hypothetical protein QF028_003050 [Neobacillus sp. B4I6]